MNLTGTVGIICAWNESSRLGAVVRNACRHLPVLVVDDGSTDETAAVAAAEGAEVLRHIRNLGKGAALRSGFAWVLERDYAAALTLDADGQHDPDEIPRFLEASGSGADLVIGRRDFSRMPFPRGQSNALGSWILSRALRYPIQDNQCGFRWHRRRLLEALDLTSRGFELEVEVIIQAVCGGFRVEWVPVRTIYDTGKVSYFHPIGDSLRFLGMVTHAARARNAVGRGRR
ncbi:MAG: glycosyltransferase family 2 protein [Anaerolineales bacterium]